MKKIIFLSFIIIALSFSTNAQSRAGVGLAYGSEIENAGIGFNGEFAASSDINIAPSLIFYFKKNNVSWWEINGNINYIFSENSATIYGIAGLNLTGIKVEGIDTNTELGLNLGIGANFDAGGSAIPFAEAKYVLGDFDQLSLFGGVRFPLN
ncbi:hypothetical protein SAMN05421640_2259 [Ekhidna lutea]|uniref:Outer membrane protein beta-barrel domain-containing protein n=1 Tax=Ekhidna lutea TaxID=447679 RepID=A0A239JMY7_EKHLU|nr:hypothetical protein [Ekhidna lutea]SNT07185.1 hypothetical protein SAMN05421640_2259 [Ekhidna lutea]